MFKVVADQLKVSQGWVRCGQCTEVFNASVYLQPHPDVASASQQSAPTPQAEEPFADAHGLAPESQPPTLAFAPRLDVGPSGLPRDVELALAAGVSESGHQASLGQSASRREKPDTGASSESHFDDALAFQISPTTAFNDSSLPSTSTTTLLLPDAAPLVVDRAADPAVAFANNDLVLPAAAFSDKPDASSPDAADELAAADVSFVRDARRQAFWRKPVVRLALGLMVVVFAALLLLQAVLHHKDALLAHEPRLKPLLIRMCEQLQCELAPLRQIDAMVIDSSSFNKLDSTSFRMSFTLKNTARSDVALPALEVTLTDAQDQALIRRVLIPSQLGAADNAVLGSGQDFSGVVVLQVLGAGRPAPDGGVAESTSGGVPMRVAGYRLLAFYP